MAYMIECVRSGNSMFGFAIGMLKENGAEKVFASMEAAKAEASRLNASSGPNVSYGAIQQIGF